MEQPLLLLFNRRCTMTNTGAVTTAGMRASTGSGATRGGSSKFLSALDVENDEWLHSPAWNLWCIRESKREGKRESVQARANWSNRCAIAARVRHGAIAAFSESMAKAGATQVQESL
jgi:hypothetical protein